MANTVADLVARLTLDATEFFRDSSKLNAALKSWDDDIRKATEGFSALGSRLTAAGASMTAISAAIAGGGFVVGDWAKDFDLAMRQVSSLLGDSGKSFDDLSAKTLALSKAMGIDATQAAQALYETLSADIPKENAITFLETASKAGIAGVTDTKTAVDGLTTVIKSFGLEVTEADKVADAMFQTVNIGKVSFRELAASIGQASGIAHQLGISYQEVMAAGATITKQGQTMSEAMTQITSAIRAMIDPTDQMKDLFEKLGVSSGRALISAKGFEGALQALTTAAGGNEVVLTKAFGRIEGFRGALALTGDQAKGAAVDLDKITHSAGAMTGAFEEIEKSWSRQLEKFWVQIKDIGIELGQSLLPALAAAINAGKPLVELFANVVNAFTGLSQPIQTAILAFTALVAAIGPLLLIAGQLVLAWTALAPVVSAVGTAASAAAPLLLALGAAFVLFTQVRAVVQDITDFASAISKAIGPLTQLNELTAEAPESVLDLSRAAKSATEEAGYFAGVLTRIKNIDWWEAIQKGLGPISLLHDFLVSIKGLTGVFPDMDDAVKNVSRSLQSHVGKTTAVTEASLRQLQAVRGLTGGLTAQERAMRAAGRSTGLVSEEMEDHLKKVAESFKKAEEQGPKSFTDAIRGLERDDSFEKTLQKWDRAIGITLPTISGEVSQAIGLIKGEWQILEREWDDVDVSALTSVISVMGDFPPAINTSTTSLNQLNAAASLIGPVATDAFAEAGTGALQFGSKIATIPRIVQIAGEDALTAASASGKAVFDEQKKVWNDVSREISTNVTNAAQKITGILLGTEEGSIGTALKTLGGTIITSLEEPFIHAFSNIIENGVKKLMGWLLSETGLSGALGSVGKLFGGIFDIGGGAASGAAGAGGSVGSGAGSAAGAAGSGAMGMVNMISGIANAAASIIGLFHSPLAGDTGKTEVNTRQIKEEMLNLRADLWSQEEHLFGKLDDWRTVLQEALGNIYSRNGEMWTSINEVRDVGRLSIVPELIAIKDNALTYYSDQRSGFDSLVSEFREMRHATLRVEVMNQPNFADLLRAQAMTTV